MQPPSKNPLVGRWVSLRPITPGDYERLRMAELDGSVIVNYRHRGTTPGPEQWVQTLWTGVLAQFMAIRNETMEPVGTVTAYNFDWKNGFASIASHVFAPFQKKAWPIEASTLFIDYLFDTFPLRKLYGDVIEPNAEHFALSLDGLVHEEARRRAHEWHGGSYVDVLTFAIYRDQWIDNRHCRPSLSALLDEDADGSGGPN